MTDTNEILVCLEQSPTILNNLIAAIPVELLKNQRIPGKWTIHEHACHIVAAQPMLIDRFRLFLNDKEPVIKPYIPGKTEPDDDLLDLDLHATLNRFPGLRSELIRTAKTYTDKHWTRRAEHDEYIEYTTGRVIVGYYTGTKVSHDLEDWQLPKNSSYFRGQVALYSLLNPNAYYEWYHLINIFVGLSLFVMVYYTLYFSFKSQWVGFLGILF